MRAQEFIVENEASKLKDLIGYLTALKKSDGLSGPEVKRLRKAQSQLKNLNEGGKWVDDNVGHTHPALKHPPRYVRKDHNFKVGDRVITPIRPGTIIKINGNRIIVSMDNIYFPGKDTKAFDAVELKDEK